MKQPADREKTRDAAEAAHRPQPSAAKQGGRQSPQAPPAGGGQEGQPQGAPRRDWLTPSAWTENPFALMRRLSDEMERFFEDLGLSRGWLGSRLGHGREFGHGLWSPQIEVSERDNQFVVCADLPGLKKEDIRVEFSDGALTIQGERRQEQEDTRGGYRRSERSYGRFYRSVPLPAGVDPEGATATFTDGVLKVVMPMPARAGRRVRRIEIRDADDRQPRGQPPLSEQTPVQQSSA